jgi:nucleotide-binding universal stress UspA family protein
MQIPGIPAGTIVVGVDGSPSSEQAIAWATDQARAERRPLTLVHGVEALDSVWTNQAGQDTRIGVDVVQTKAERLLAHARELVEHRAPEVEVHELSRVLDPRDVLLQASQTATMVVLGSRGRGPIRSLLLGSVGVAVTRHAACPVVVLRPANPGKVRQGVVVGVDGTPASQGPLEFAYRQASFRAMPLTVVHAFPDFRAPTTDVHVIGDDEHGYDEERSLLAEVVAGMTEKYPDVPVRTQLVRGLPDVCLLRMSSRMNLLVIGAHHGGPAAGLVFGSVASSVVEHATCAVAVVPVADRG